ncbi:MAG: PAS domain S-box protein [Acidobacteria bacterium]|nr:PAS domain S-box protein [Acidobacteriota bacterium]
MPKTGPAKKVTSSVEERLLRVLVVEDNPADAELVLRELKKAGFACSADKVETREEFLNRLDTASYDLILADYNLRGWTATDALDYLQQQGKDIPFVLVTGTLGDEAAVECIKQGAADYVLKDRLARLPAAVDRALREKAQRDEAAQLQDRILRAKKEWELTFDSVADPVVLLDDEGHIQRANRAAAALLGVEPRQLIGRLCYETLHGREDPLPTCPHQLIRKTGEVARGDVYESHLGKVFDTSVTPLRDPSGGLSGCIYVMHDVTERKRAEQALRQSEEKFAKAFRSSPDAITLATVGEGRYVEVNPGFLRLSGYRREEVIGHTVFELNLWADPAGRAGLIEQVRQQGAVSNREIAFQTKTGEVRTGLLSAELIEFDGEPCLLAITRDITERRQAEEQVRQLNQELEQRVAERTAQLQTANEALARANQMKSDFLADMSHELRTPLNSILGFSELLLERATGLTPKQRDDLGIVHRKGQHLLALVNDLLDLSQIESGQVLLDWNLIPVQDTLACILDAFAVRLREKNLKHSLEVTPPDLRIHADPRRLEEILTNLIANAIRFTQRGGIAVRARAVNQHVEFSVEDTGIGIRAEDQARVFDKFFQAHHSAETSGIGTGLGLAIAKRLVELHGGRLWLESTPGTGSRFFFALPRSQPLPAPGSPPGERP